jgi:hypothetical protein
MSLNVVVFDKAQAGVPGVPMEIRVAATASSAEVAQNATG